MSTIHLALAQELAQAFAGFPSVQAVAVSGSLASPSSDGQSDIDLYVYTSTPIPLADRATLVEHFGASRQDLDLQYWGAGDEWFHAASGIEVDVMYWAPEWVEAQLERLWVQHQASLGYSTCFWHTLRQSLILFDRVGWLAALQQKAQQEYPEALRRAIIVTNYPVLRGVIPAYLTQIEKAVRRGDLVSVNHRLAALFASYFDILFALNRVLHPGEKRLVQQVSATCAWAPQNMEADIRGVLQAAGTGVPELLEWLALLLDHLDELLLAQGFDPRTGLPF